MKKLVFGLIGTLILSTNTAFAHGTDKHDADSHEHEKDHKKDHHKMIDQSMNHSMHSMSATTNYDAPMQRNGSGTAWLPDSSPMYAGMFMLKNWSFMVHGSIFGRYNTQNPFNTGKRGGTKFDAPNWFMLMAQTPVLTNDRLTFKSMLSLDPLTEGGAGYPLLFQSGESWMNKPLVDAQHPHDFFSELSATYTHSINEDSSVFGYIGFPGEPALGPTAFMHRPSAFSNPDAPIGHHWQDATHILFGVATLGWVYKDFKLDTSIFTGREPDENRFNFDMPKFDSYSARMTFNPSKDLSLQTSFGYLKSPEALSPNSDTFRATSSITHNKTFNKKYNDFTNLATTLVWGMNIPISTSETDHHMSTPLNSLLLESNLQYKKDNFLFAKMEYVQKNDHELVLNLNSEKIFNVFTLTFGGSRNIFTYLNTVLSAGAQASIYFPQSDLEQFYGKTPLAFQAYLRLTPDLMNMQDHEIEHENHEHEKHNHEHMNNHKMENCNMSHEDHKKMMEDCKDENCRMKHMEEMKKCDDKSDMKHYHENNDNHSHDDMNNNHEKHDHDEMNHDHENHNDNDNSQNNSSDSDNQDDSEEDHSGHNH